MNLTMSSLIQEFYQKHQFNNVFNYNNETYFNTKNEIVKAIEVGYGYKSRNFN